MNYNTPALIIDENLLDDNDMSTGIIAQFKAAFPTAKEAFQFFKSGAAIIGKSTSPNGNVSYVANTYHFTAFFIQGGRTIVAIGYTDMDDQSTEAAIEYGGDEGGE